jgi:uncharacterized protein YoaH (UPF0181 family)
MLKNDAQERLEALLIEGLESGPGIEVTGEYIKQRRQRLFRKYSRPKTEGLSEEKETTK